MAPFSSRNTDASTTCGHGRQPSGERVRDDGVERFARPERAVADDAGMDGVHPDRRQFDRQRADHANNSGVDGADRRRARVWPFPCHATEEQDGAVAGEPVRERMHHFGVADQLERHEVDRGLDVVGADTVGVAVDCGEDHVVDRPEPGETAARSPAAWTGPARGSRRRRRPRWRPSPRCGVPAGEHHVAATARVVVGQVPADSGGAADDEHRASHVSVLPLWNVLKACDPQCSWPGPVTERR